MNTINSTSTLGDDINAAAAPPPVVAKLGHSPHEAFEAVQRGDASPAQREIALDTMLSAARTLTYLVQCWQDPDGGEPTAQVKADALAQACDLMDAAGALNQRTTAEYRQRIVANVLEGAEGVGQALRWCRSIATTIVDDPIGPRTQALAEAIQFIGDKFAEQMEDALETANWLAEEAEGVEVDVMGRLARLNGEASRELLKHTSGLVDRAKGAA